ncbi:MAG: hypothetical protein LQ348_001791 [Seirophora lacunosa]|nr:MAG: hypothetical protein LQ348_001791 [Seirophora lacunosa]
MAARRGVRARHSSHFSEFSSGRLREWVDPPQIYAMRGDGFKPLTVEERLMMSRMNELTDDPSWAQLITNDAFVEDWKHRSLSQYPRITQQMLDWCVQEVRDRAIQFHQTGLIPALDHGVLKSDTVVGSALNLALQNSLRRLERVSGYDKFHRSEASQSFIVDPYLYPLRFGLTRYCSSAMSTFKDGIRLSGKGISRSLLPPQVNGTLNDRWSYQITNAFSLRFQWLPCDISFDEDTSKARYINNVHPLLDGKLYIVANELLSAFTPMLNNTLMAVKTSQLFDPRIDPEQRISRQDLPDPDPGSYRSFESRVRSVNLTEDGKLPTSARVDLQKEFWDIGIQAVIQVSSIDLDQERPHYSGENWHVQGQLNERVCATLVYCYSCENTTDASISFRHRCSSDDLMSLNSLTKTTKTTEDVYGVEDLRPALQEQGSVMIREGRVISFPNVGG